MDGGLIVLKGNATKVKVERYLNEKKFEFRIFVKQYAQEKSRICLQHRDMDVGFELIGVSWSETSACQGVLVAKSDSSLTDRSFQQRWSQ